MFTPRSFRARIGLVEILCVACVCVLLSCIGCATLKDLASPNNSAVQQIAVQYATGKFIEAKPAAERAARAKEVKAVALAVRQVASSDSSTVVALQALASAKVAASGLQGADRLLADALVAAVVQELSSRVSTGVLTPENQVIVAKVLDWVVAAADAYGAGA